MHSCLICLRVRRYVCTHWYLHIGMNGYVLLCVGMGARGGNFFSKPQAKQQFADKLRGHVRGTSRCLTATRALSTQICPHNSQANRSLCDSLTAKRARASKQHCRCLGLGKEHRAAHRRPAHYDEVRSGSCRNWKHVPGTGAGQQICGHASSAAATAWQRRS